MTRNAGAAGAAGVGIDAGTFTTDAQLMEDYLQSAGILVNPENAGVNQITAFRNAEGQSEAIVIDPDGVVFHVCREPLSDSGWNMYGIGAGFETIAAIDSATVWACGTQGDIWRGDHGRWSQTSTLGSGNAAIGVSAGTDGTVWATDTAGLLFVLGASTGVDEVPAVNSGIAPVFTLDSAGMLNLFCVDSDGAVWTVRQRVAGGSWAVWQNLGAPSTGGASTVTVTAFVVEPNADGRLQVFAVGSDAALHTIWEQRPGGNWSTWGRVSQQDPAIATLVGAVNQDGRIELFVLSQPDQSGNVTLSHIWQTEPNRGWSAWSVFAQPWSDALDGLAVTREAAGSLHLVLISNDNLACLWAKQSTPGGDWTGWQTIGTGMPTVQGTPALAVDANGDVAIFVIDDLTRTGLGLSVLAQSGGTWSTAWLPLGSPLPFGVPLGSPVVARNADGRLEVFAQGDGRVFHLWQTTPGGAATNWSNWASLGQPGGNQSAGSPLNTFAVVLNGGGALELIALSGATSWHTGHDTSFSSNGNWMPWIAAWWAWYPIAGGSALTSMPAGTADDFRGIGSTGGLVRRRAQAWSSTALPSGLSATCITVDVDGAVWILCNDPQGTFLRLIDGAFQKQTATLPGATSISARDGSGIWATAAGPKAGIDLYVLRDAQWVSARTPHLFNLHWNNTAAVSIGAGGALWLLDGSRNVWRQTMTPATWRWSAFPLATSTMRTLTAARGGNAWGVAQDGSVWQFKGSWRPFAPALPSGSIAELSSGVPGTLWAIDASGNAYSYSSSGGWTAISDTFFGPLIQSPTSWAVAAQSAYEYQQPDPPAPGNWAALQVWTEFMATQFTVGSDGTVVVLDTAGALHAFRDPPAWMTNAPANLVQVAAVNATRAWAIAKAPGNTTPTLHLYRDGAWESITTSPELLVPSGSAGATPQLSSAGDGTVWLLSANGVPQRLDWSERVTTWSARPAPSGIASVAAVNVNGISITSPQQQQAWATTPEGALRRNFGDGGAWLDTATALPGGAAAAEVSVGTDGSVWTIDSNGALYAKQSWSQLPAAPGSGPIAAAAAIDSANSLLLFTLDASGAAWAAARRTGATAWDDWQTLSAPPQPLTALAAGTAQDGLARVVGLTSAGIALIAAERSTAPTWGPFTRLGTGGQPSGIALGSLATSRDATNRLHVFGLGGDGSVWTIAEGASGAWSTWSAISSGAGTFTALGGAAMTASGVLTLFALDASGVVHRSAFTPAGSGSWGAWQPIVGGLPNGVSLTQVVAGAHRDGALHVIASASDNRLYASSGPGASASTWSEWSDVGAVAGVEPQSLSTAVGAGSVLSAFMRGGDGALYVATLGTQWSTWTPLGAVGTDEAPLNSLLAQGDAAGVVHVFAGGAGSLWGSLAQASSPTGFSDWTPLSGAQSWQKQSAPAALAHAPAGRAAELWAAFTDGTIRRSNSTGAWQTIAFPSSSAPEKALGVSVGTDGVIWAITATTCQRWTSSSNSWSLAGPGTFTQAPVGSASDLWTIDARGVVWRSATAGATWWEDRSPPEPMRSISACADGSIWGVGRTGIAWLASAWQRIMRPTGMPGFSTATGASEVSAGVDENGLRHLFLVAGGTLYGTYELAHHAWLAPAPISPAGTTISGIVTTRQQDTGALIVYAPPTDGAVSFATVVPGQPYQFNFVSASAFVDSGSLQLLIGSSIELIAIDGQNWIWLVASNGSLYGSSTPATPEQVIFAVIETGQTITAASVLPLPWIREAAAPFGAVIDTSGQLWIVGDLSFLVPSLPSGTLLQLTGSETALVNGAGGYAPLLQQETWAPAQPRFYAMASNTAAGSAAALWMLVRANLFASIVTPKAWSAWTPLGDDFTAIYAGPTHAAADTLFAIDAASSSLAALAQNPTTGALISGVVKRPSQSGDDILSIATYQSEATLLDANGIPAANASVTLFADSPVDAWVNNTLRALGPVHGATVRSDALGRIAVRTIATRLHAPQLTLVPAAASGASLRFHAGSPGAAGVPAAATPSTIAPSQRVYTFLQGKGQLPIGGAPPTNLTPSGLQSLNSNLDTRAATTAVNDINTIANVPAASAPGAMPPWQAWRIRDDRILGEPGSIFSDAWDHIKHAGEAVVHAVEKGIVKAAVSVEGDIVTITITVGDEVVAALKSAVRSVEDAVRAIEVLVRSVVADIKAFIDWLKLLLDWTKIVETQDAMIGFIQQAIALLQSQITALEGKVAQVFGDLEAQFDSAFPTITSGSSIAGFDTFGSLPNTVQTSGARARLLRGPSPVLPSPASGEGEVPSPSRGGRRRDEGGPRPHAVSLAASTLPRSAGTDSDTIGGVVPAQPVSGASSVHQNWFLRKVLDHVTPAFALPAIDGVDASTLLDHLDVENAIGQISAAAQDLLQFFSTLFEHPSEIAQQGIIDLLKASEALLNALIDIVEDLVEAFLGLAQAILAGLLDMLNTRVHIPLIDTLFALIDHKPMTYMNLGTLAVAAPTYIVFETIYPGQGPPFQGLGANGEGGAEAPSTVGHTWTPEQQWAAGFLAFGLVNWVMVGASNIETIVVTPEAPADRVPVFGPVLTLVNSVVAIMMRISGWPGPGGFPNLPDTTPTAAEVANWFNSAVLWGPPLLAVTASGVPALDGDVKQVVNTVMGGAASISGIVAAIEGLGETPPISGEKAAQIVITPIGLTLSWLLIKEVRQSIWESSEETFDPAWIIFVVNLIDNLAAPILHEVSAMEEA